MTITYFYRSEAKHQCYSCNKRLATVVSENILKDALSLLLSLYVCLTQMGLTSIRRLRACSRLSVCYERWRVRIVDQGTRTPVIFLSSEMWISKSLSLRIYA